MNRSIARLGLLVIFFTGSALAGQTPPCDCGNICSPQTNCGLKSCPTSRPKKKVPHAPDLKEEYDKYNLKYFSGKLPKDTVISWEDLGNENGVERIAITAKLDDGRFQIIFNPKFGASRYFTLFVLLHEMAHISTWSNDLAHGPVWQKEMHRLADEGAFELLW